MSSTPSWPRAGPSSRSNVNSNDPSLRAARLIAEACDLLRVAAAGVGDRELALRIQAIADDVSRVLAVAESRRRDEARHGKK